jgi:two-component system cell cycle response regulator
VELKHFHPTILLVEDEPLTRRQLSEMLEEWPARVYTAENGEQGLCLYREQQPDIVITDVIMPVMSGLEMARRIRKRSSKVKIIGITAYVEADDREDNGETSLDYSIPKPIHLDRLFAALEQCREELFRDLQTLPF